MSTCISSHGEFGSHVLDNLHTCTRCHVLDEDAMRVELGKLRAELDRVTGERDDAVASLQTYDHLSEDFHSANSCGENKAKCPGCVIAQLTSERDEAQRIADNTRTMAIAANADLRSKFLAALDLADDGRTSLGEYADRLIAERDALQDKRDGEANDAIHNAWRIVRHLRTDIDNVVQAMKDHLSDLSARQPWENKGAMEAVVVVLGNTLRWLEREGNTSQPAPTFSQDWEHAKDSAIEAALRADSEVLTAGMPPVPSVAELARQVAQGRAKETVVEAAKAWRLLWPLDKPGLDPTTYVRQEVELYLAVDALAALESTPTDADFAAVAEESRDLAEFALPAQVEALALAESTPGDEIDRSSVNDDLPRWLELAHGLIASAWDATPPFLGAKNGGEWLDAAERWRDWYHRWLDQRYPRGRTPAIDGLDGESTPDGPGQTCVCTSDPVDAHPGAWQLNPDASCLVHGEKAVAS